MALMRVAVFSYRGILQDAYNLVFHIDYYLQRVDKLRLVHMYRRWGAGIAQWWAGERSPHTNVDRVRFRSGVICG